MPNSSGLAGICTVVCGVETGSATCAVLAVASVTGESEVAAVFALTVLAYVLVYGCTAVSNHKVN